MSLVSLLSRLVYGVALCLTIGCSPVPRQYLREAVPNLTFSALTAAPQAYHDQLVVMGAVIVKEETRNGALWLHVKNRPLDKHYRPQLPPTPHDSEAGWYWIVVETPQMLPSSYHHWADMTVVGRVTGLTQDRQPILEMVYAQGWEVASASAGVWEHLVDMNYVPSRPAGILGELGQGQYEGAQWGN